MDTTVKPKQRGQVRTYLPPSATTVDEVVDFARSLRRSADQTESAKLVAPDGSEKKIPVEIFDVLEQVANALAEGNGVTIAPYRMQLTTQEAADFLGISRPTLVKLLEAGEVPFETLGRHRRVTLRDIVEFQERRRTERRAGLKEMTQIAQRIGMEPGAVPQLKRLDEFQD